MNKCPTKTPIHFESQVGKVKVPTSSVNHSNSFFNWPFQHLNSALWCQRRPLYQLSHNCFRMCPRRSAQSFKRCEKRWEKLIVFIYQCFEPFHVGMKMKPKFSKSNHSRLYLKSMIVKQPKNPRRLSPHL